MVNTLLLLFLCFVTLYPVWYCLCASFTSTSYLSTHQGILFWPHQFTVSAYRMAFTHPLLLSGYKNTLIVLLVSLPINIVLTIFTGYYLASKDVMLKPVIQFVIVIDEWDAIFREYKEDKEGKKKYLEFLRDCMKDKTYIALVYMTGILPIKKYGKHSAFNMV